MQPPIERPVYSRLAVPIKPQYREPKKARKRSLVEYFLFGVFAIILVIGAVALYTMYSPARKRYPNRVAEGMKADRINLLLIGIGGEAHIVKEGNDLADSIMLVSLKPSTKQVALVSIPRDLYVPIGHFGTHRINAAHDIGGKVNYPGDGPGLLADTVSQLTGQPIHAFVRVDFAAFEKIIDQLGGIDIYVHRPFYDYLFKDGFQAGWQHMNGDRALRYARYRYVHGAEGNNFARELRQQQVIAAIRDKIHNLKPQEALKVVAIATTVSKDTTTNLTTTQMLSLYQTFHSVQKGSIRHVSLAPLTEIFSVPDPKDQGEAVRPRTGNFGEIQSMAANVFSDMKPIVTRDEIQLSDQTATPIAHEAPGVDPTPARPQKAVVAH
jgi:LCP family protein required for cell wall assembly